MTFVSVISSAVARIKQSESLNDDEKELLNGLEGIKISLGEMEARPDFIELEKEAVHLADEIADAITDASSSSFKPKENYSFGSFISTRKTEYQKPIKELQKNLTDLQNKLQKKNHDPAASEMEDHNPKMAKNQEKKSNKGFLSNIARRGSANISKMIKKDKAQGKPDPEVLMAKEKDPEGKPDPEVLITKESFPVQVQGKPDPMALSTNEKKNLAGKPNPEVLIAKEKNPAESSKSSFDDLLIQLREELMDPKKPSEMYLVGKSGMGRTTLSRELFDDDKLRAYFEVFAWVPMTHNFQIKRVLHLLLQQLSPELDIRAMNEIELITNIFPLLNKKRYLIVLDDINSVDDWESIRLALPIAKSAKVIITCASDIAPGEKDHRRHISGFNKSDILSLLGKETPFISEKVGEAIYDISGGSPLFAIILGKSLDPPKATDTEQELIDQLRSYETHSGKSRVLGACYKRLAPELKPCLLYLALFPQGEDIEVNKFYSLLAAENLIPQKEYSAETPDPKSPRGDMDASLMVRDYLDRLALLKFVQLQKDIVPTMSGLYRSCRLHDQVRDFCISQASEEEFIEIVDYENSTRQVGSRTRRLAVYLRGYSNSINPSITPATLKKLYTLAVFDTSHELDDHQKSAAGWPLAMNDLTESSQLRILNFKGVNFQLRKLPKGLERLFHLRYLSFRGCWLTELQSSLSSLTQLETLDLVVGADCTMLIPSNLFTNMTRMVHLYFPRLYKMIGASSKVKLQHMQRLETLVNFDTEIFDADALSHPTKLKILSTISRGNLDTTLVEFLEAPDARSLQYSSVEITGFDSYNAGSFSALEKLLQCKHVNSIRIDGRIGELPKDESGRDAQKIWEINLEGSQLQLDPMIYFGKFESLQRLVLGKDAYLGTVMHISLLPNLRSLKLHNLQYLEMLTIQKNALPKLSALQIHSCDCLNHLYIPKELHARLVNTRRGNIGDAYSVMPTPKYFFKT